METKQYKTDNYFFIHLMGCQLFGELDSRVQAPQSTDNINESVMVNTSRSWSTQVFFLDTYIHAVELNDQHFETIFTLPGERFFA